MEVQDTSRDLAAITFRGDSYYLAAIMTGGIYQNSIFANVSMIQSTASSIQIICGVKLHTSSLLMM